MAQNRGTVKCGDCGLSFDALSFLFDDRPASQTTPPTPESDATPPVLGKSPERERDSAGEVSSSELAPDNNAPADPNQRVWVTVLALLIFISLANLAWTFREPLLRDPEVRTFLTEMGLLESGSLETDRDLQGIHLVSRDMHPHPSRSGILVLSFTYVSRSQLEQPYPEVELILFDTSNETLASRIFTPAEYLPAFDPQANLLTPGVHVPVLLEFEDPGVAATGFQLNFQ